MKKHKTKIILLFLMGLLSLPFFLIPEHAILISASSAGIMSLVFIFYQAALIFFDKSEDNLAYSAPLGLPGEKKTHVTSGPKKQKTNTKLNLPGASNTNKTSVSTDFEIEVEAPIVVKPLVELNKVDVMRGLLESISFWDDASFYKIKDSEVYSNDTVKMIGELYDFVFSGLATYLMRYKLTLDDVFNEDIVVKEYNETYSSVVFGFVISLIEKAIASHLHMKINSTEIILPKVKTKNPDVAKVLQSSEFKYQVLLIIRKFYENNKQD